MSGCEAPGLPADWLNGWLAAIGVTVLVPGVRLAWSDDVVPSAVFEHDQPEDLADVLAGALPTAETLASSAIARTRPDAAEEFRRNVTMEAFRERAMLERRDQEGFLAASVSDLSSDAKPEDLAHGAFDPAVPRGITLWERAVNCANALAGPAVAQRVRDTLNGLGQRENINGLGFDARRLPGGMHAAGDAGVYADPVIELLAYSALPLFPVRGDGTQVLQRGWTDASTRRGAFRWSAWRPPLDQWGIDAFLDLPPQQAGRFTIASYQVVPYQLSDPNDRRAYFAERIP